jgi:membrane-bound metal-dependent hydrolase YbcI (DUF457 family)
MLDADHVPEVLGLLWLRRHRRMRPVTHSLLVAAGIAAGAARVRPGPAGSAFARGAAVGLAGHLGRDLATGTTTVPLFWPASGRAFAVRYPLYAAALAWGVLRAAPRDRPTPGPEQPRGGPEPASQDIRT